MIRYGILAVTVLLCRSFSAQSGYDINIQYKNLPDTTVYLARYFWDQLPIVDSAKNIQNGHLRFSGREALQKGVYFIANQARDNFYFQFIVGEDQKFKIRIDHNDRVNTGTSDDKQNQAFFDYVKFMTAKNLELQKIMEKASSMENADSSKTVDEARARLNAETTKFDLGFMEKNKGSFLHDFMNLKNEKLPDEIPLASNGRPDSLFQYRYYKEHYWDGVDFKDDRILRTPFFAAKFKKYFEQVIPQAPDTVIRELDLLLKECVPGSDMYKTIVGHMLHKYEQDKTMIYDQYGNCHSFEKVFVHLADNYVLGGKMKGYYSEETEELIGERIAVLKHLLPGSRVPDLFMIDTINGQEVKQMGFDTVTTSESATYLYNRKVEKLQPMFRSLYQVQAKYTVLAFWAVDCGTCKKEIPKLHEELQKLKGKADVQVFAVQTKSELFNDWKKFIREKELVDFIHVFDPVHLNNLKEQFDIVATPVVYLLDRNKTIKGKKLTPEQVVEVIENLESIEKNHKK